MRRTSSRLVHDVRVIDPLAFAEHLPGRPTSDGPPRDPFEVRVATPEDDADLGRLVGGTRDHRAVTARLRDDVVDPDRLVLVARDRVDGGLLGYGRVGFLRPPDITSADRAPTGCAPAGWYLIGLVVDPEQRRRGIGTALTTARMRSVGDRADHVWYFTNARNRVSLELHAGLGFREMTRDFWVPGVTFDGGVGVLGRAILSTAGRTA